MFTPAASSHFTPIVQHLSSHPELPEQAKRSRLTGNDLLALKLLAIKGFVSSFGIDEERMGAFMGLPSGLTRTQIYDEGSIRLTYELSADLLTQLQKVSMPQPPLSKSQALSQLVEVWREQCIAILDPTAEVLCFAIDELELHFKLHAWQQLELSLS